jgi:hypothetical protein
MYKENIPTSSESEVELNQENDNSLGGETVDKKTEIIASKEARIVNSKEDLIKAEASAYSLDSGAIMNIDECNFVYFDLEAESILNTKSMSNCQIKINGGEVRSKNIKDSIIRSKSKLFAETVIDAKLNFESGSTTEIKEISESFITIADNCNVFFDSVKDCKIKVGKGSKVDIEKELIGENSFISGHEDAIVSINGVKIILKGKTNLSALDLKLENVLPKTELESEEYKDDEFKLIQLQKTRDRMQQEKSKNDQLEKEFKFARDEINKKD